MHVVTLNNQKQWEKLKQKGLSDKIAELDDYVIAVSKGLYSTGQYLEANCPGIPDIAQLRTAHYLAFKDVHAWAGTFRKPNESSAIAGFPACDPVRIQRELKITELQVQQIAFSESLPPLTAAAFYHVRLERIHPFKDGNGRVGREILTAQLRANVKNDLPILGNREEYLHAMKQANSGELSDLLNYLNRTCGIKSAYTSIKSPFRMAAFFRDDPSVFPSISEEFEESKIKT